MAILLLLIGSNYLYAQNSVVFGEKFVIKADFIKKDSILVINYKNLMPFSQLVWANDFCITAIISPSDVSGSYLASPITQEIYLVNKTLQPNKTSNSFFLRNDSTELDLYNYKILDTRSEMEVRLKVNNDQLYKLIVNKKLILKGMMSFIDFTNIELLASEDKEKGKKLSELLANYTQKKNPSNTLAPILLKNIIWQFSRKANVVNVNGLPSGIAQEGNLEKEKLVHSNEKHKDKLILFSYEELYRFSNRQVFNVEIGLK